MGSEWRGRPSPRGGCGKLRAALPLPENIAPSFLLCPVGPVPPALPPRKSTPDCAQVTGVGEEGQQRPPRMTQHWTPCRGEPGNVFLFSARKTKTWRRQVLARPTGWTRGDHSRRQLALPRGCPKPLLLSPHLLPLISSECAHRGLPVAASPGIRSPASTANTPTVTVRSSWRLPTRLCVCACVCLCVLTKRG